MKILNQALNTYNSGGISTLLIRTLGFIYNRTIRPWLPKTKKYTVFNRVRRERKHIFDERMPFPTPGPADNSKYEDNLGEAIRSYIDDGETVLEVATGVGITAVIAARCVGLGGKVVTYEASKSKIKEARKVIKLNDVEDRVEINQSIVETDVSRFSDKTTAENSISASKLPMADVFIIDCDGCEFDILQSSEQLPEKLIIEHHAVFDIEPEIEYQPDKIRNKLHEMGYDILSTTVTEMDESLPQFGDAETVFVAQKQSPSE